MDQLTHGSGETCGYRYVFVFTVALGILYNYISGLTCGPPGDRGECLLPLPEYCHDKGHT